MEREPITRRGESDDEGELTATETVTEPGHSSVVYDQVEAVAAVEQGNTDEAVSKTIGQRIAGETTKLLVAIPGFANRCNLAN